MLSWHAVIYGGTLNTNEYISCSRSSYFTVVPTYTITLGVYTFMTSFFGFAVSGTEKSILIGSYAAFLAVAFLAQLASIFTCLELRSIITQAGIQV